MKGIFVNALYFGLNIFGIVVFVGISFLISKRKKDVNWLSIGILLALNVVLAWFFLRVPIGQEIIKAAVNFFASLVTAASEGVAFAFGDALTSTSEQIKTGVQTSVFFASALLPIIVIVPLFDILTYIGLLPIITRYVGAVRRVNQNLNLSLQS